MMSQNVTSRPITKYDYGYTDDYKWDGGIYRPDKNAYSKALKLSNDQIIKFETLNNLIGFEVDFRIGKKTYRATVVAVSLPDSTVTSYPSGEFNPHTNKEFIQNYSACPFTFNLAIGDRSNFWSSKIDNIDLSNIKEVGVFFESNIPSRHFKYKNLESITNI